MDFLGHRNKFFGGETYTSSGYHEDCHAEQHVLYRAAQRHSRNQKQFESGITVTVPIPT